MANRFPGGRRASRAWYLLLLLPFIFFLLVTLAEEAPAIPALAEGSTSGG
jgi:hypothetical protein